MITLSDAVSIAENYINKRYPGTKFGEYSETEASYLFALDIDWISVNKHDGSVKDIWFKDIFEDDELWNTICKNRNVLDQTALLEENTMSKKNENDENELNEENKLDEEKAEEMFEEQQSKAEELLNDEDKMERFLQKLEKKLKTVPMAGTSLSYVPIMISLVRKYIKKEYTDLPVTSIVSIVTALIYVLSPIDLIPDFIPALGLTDDAAVIVACLTLVRTDIEDYKRWRAENGMELDDLPDYDDIANEAEKNKSLFNAFIKGRKSANKKKSDKEK